MRNDLKSVQKHFAFGANWRSYAGLVNEEHVKHACVALERLVGADRLQGGRFLDIGCGSGLHMLAAARLGAAAVTGIDIDPDSTETAERVLRAHGVINGTIRNMSVFAADLQTLGQFDIVYSWGALHHTGAMHEAIAQAASLVSPGGLLCVAMYRKTMLCPLWRLEKQWYAQATPKQQKIAQEIYIRLMRLAFLARGRDFAAYIRDYKKNRGMDYRHDVHDWLGGYPYESISPREMCKIMEELGFDQKPIRSFVRPGRLGLFGSGCDEYVFRRPE